MTREEFEMIPTREVCSICGNISRVGFWVPDKIWKQVMSQQNDIVCLECFTKRADEKLIEWDKDIRLYPVSFKTHLKIVREIS